jgi:hypothetical protein
VFSASLTRIHIFLHWQVSPEFHLHTIGDLIGPATPAFYGVLFALQRCREVSLYGFSRLTGGKDNPCAP